jgi:D-glycero-D-manno-heptose 1,7-bisphosphate phosphatase
MKLIILDRDGVINHDSDHYIKSPDEWRPIAGSLEAIARLTQWNWRVVIATNQSGIGRQLFNMQTLIQIHNKMHHAVAQAGGRIDAIFFCPHTDADRCTCRKPKPGLFQEIADRYRVDLAGVPAIGDSWRDIQAAQSAGARAHLVLTGNGELTRSSPEFLSAMCDIPVHADLAEAVNVLLQED